MTEDPSNDQIDGTEDVTNWFRELEKGDENAAEKLWEYCVPKMLAHSRRRLPASFCKVLDEEDIALSAFRSLCERARRGDLQSIQGRNELLKLLSVITTRKTLNYIKHETREKRGSGKVRGESWFSSAQNGDGCHPNHGMDGCEGPSDSPALMAQYTEQCKQMLGFCTCCSFSRCAISCCFLRCVRRRCIVRSSKNDALQPSNTSRRSTCSARHKM